MRVVKGKQLSRTCEFVHVALKPQNTFSIATSKQTYLRGCKMFLKKYESLQLRNSRQL